MTNIFTRTCRQAKGAEPGRMLSWMLFMFKHQCQVLLVLLLAAGSIQAVYAASPTGSAVGVARDLLDNLDNKACPPDLVHYFGFDEKAPGPYLDYTTNTTTSCSSCPAPVQGLFGGAQHFNGSSRVNFDQTRNFQWGPNSSFTIEVWVRTTATSGTNQVLIGRDAKDSQAHWWLGITPEGYATFLIRDRTGNTVGLGGENEGTIKRKINDGNWHHIVVVRDGTTSTKERHTTNKIYVDGFAIYSLEHPFGGDYLNTSPINIGYLDLHGGYRYTGDMDELMVYDRNLSESEVRSRYNNGAGSYCGPENVATRIVSEPVTYGVLGQNYFYDVNATGSPVPVFTLLSAPQGMAIDRNTGEIYWTPTTKGTFEVVVQAENSLNADVQRFTINVKEGLEEIPEVVHHWMLHEIVGTRYKDYYTPYHAIATEETRPTPITGVVSGGQRFDGNDDGLDVVGSPNFDWEADANFTIELWMRTTVTPSGNQVMMGRSAKDSQVQWWIGVNPQGNAAFVMFDWTRKGTAVVSSGTKINDGNWHQIVAVRESGSSKSKIFIDGEPAGEQTYKFQNGFGSRSPVNIGYLNEASGYHYEGDLDEVKLFGRPLAATEIKERYNAVFSAITELVLFEGHYESGSVYLKWETMNEVDCESFEIERSEDGEIFTAIGEVDATGPSTDRLTYRFTDPAPLSGTVYYRLKINKTSGRHTYSNIIIIESGGFSASTFLLYPNPVITGDVNMEVTNFPSEEEVTIVISDLSGKRVLQEQVTTDIDGYLNLSFYVDHKFRPGIYNVSVVSEVKTLSRKLVVAE